MMHVNTLAQSSTHTTHQLTHPRVATGPRQHRAVLGVSKVRNLKKNINPGLTVRQDYPT
jgi:hypothetical protein